MLEIIERLLASLIVLAMLILVFFIAFPSTQTETTDGDLPPKEEERIAPGGGKRQTPPEVAQKDDDKPAAPNAETAAPEGKQAEKPAVVPDPSAPKPETPKEDPGKQALNGGSQGDKAPSSSTAKSPAKEQDQIAEQKIPRPVPNTDKKGEKEKVRFAKNGQTAGEVKPPYHWRYPKQARDSGRNDYDGVHVRQTQYRERSRRNHYYECEGGECDCDCDQPYWSRNGQICEEERSW